MKKDNEKDIIWCCSTGRPDGSGCESSICNAEKSSVQVMKRTPLREKVIFVKTKKTLKNADGVKGHLESVGNSDYAPSFMTNT